MIAIATLGGLVIGAIVMGAVLIFTGTPEACADRTIPVSTAAAQQSRTLWKEFKASAATGPASVTFSETHITSRGVEWVEEKDAPVEDLQVYLCPSGYGEATGTVSYLGRDIKVLARGTLDLSGDRPRIEVKSVEAGNLPSAVGTRIVNAILNTNDLKTLDLSVTPDTIKIVDQSATLTKR
ncbi:MAG: hypothetical protein IPI85_02345 [Dehalococcoidia bacterium]|nr:hypothetical protein [Dehalococcoidia bacterium]